jgi:hypothetical protein
MIDPDVISALPMKHQHDQDVTRRKRSHGQVPISFHLAATYEDFSIIDPIDRERAFGQNDHVQIYVMDYVDRLKQAGFAVDLFDWRRDNGDYGGENNKFGLIECLRRPGDVWLGPNRRKVSIRL